MVEVKGFLMVKFSHDKPYCDVTQNKQVKQIIGSNMCTFVEMGMIYFL